MTVERAAGHTTSFAAGVRRRLALLTRAERVQWLTLFPLGVLAAVLETLGGLVVFGLIAALSGSRTVWPLLPGELDAAIARTGIGVSTLSLTLFATGIYLVRSAVLIAAAYYRAHVAGSIAARLAGRIAAGYLMAPYAFLRRKSSAEVSQNLLTGVPAVVQLLESLPTITTELLVVGGLLLLLLRVAPIETLAAAAVVGLVLGVFVRLSRARYHAMGARHFELGEAVQRHVQEGLGAMKEIKVFGREPYFLAPIAREQGARARIAFNLARLETVPRLLTETAFALAFLAFILVLELRGSHPGALLPFVGLFAYAGFRTIPAGHRLSVQFGLVRYGLAVSDAVCRDAEDAREWSRPAAGAGHVRFEQRIRLDGVSYRHDDAGGDRVLRGVDLEIAKGECVAIVGATGAGKTTLVDLVLGLLQPSEGHITVDGVPIADDLDGWRRQVGYVPQSPFLIDDTLRRNIAFGVPDHEIDDAAVQSVVRIAQLTSLVSAMPAGLDTLLGERGIRLSGGERQRVAIARALYHDPGVLILDEATSALDPGTELDLTRAIDLLKGRKTLIVVAHRPTTVERADRVIVLRDGRVDAIGSRDALIRSSAAFRQIAALSTDTTGAGRGDRTTG